MKRNVLRYVVRGKLSELVSKVNEVAWLTIGNTHNCVYRKERQGRNERRRRNESTLAEGAIDFHANAATAANAPLS
jgi:hypothetical protein